MRWRSTRKHIPQPQGEENRFFTDMMWGDMDEREGLQRLLVRAEQEDIILCTKMDQLGRNTSDMIKIVDTCYKKR